MFITAADIQTEQTPVIHLTLAELHFIQRVFYFGFFGTLWKYLPLGFFMTLFCYYNNLCHLSVSSLCHTNKI